MVLGAPTSIVTKTKKGERTRQAILDAAHELLLENGYEATTMRAVAERAGVSVGNAYYYFESKEHLIQGFYARTHREHLEVCEPLLEGEKDFATRLRIALVTKIETTEPYHRFAGVLFRTAADPRSPLNPFSEASREVREECTALFARVLEGSDKKLPKDLAPEMPGLLWMHLMSITLFWIHDESEGRKRTRALIDRTVELISTLTSLARLPLTKPLRRNVIQLLGELRGES